MKSNESKYALNGLFAGVIIGALVGLGSLYYVKNSSKGLLFPISVCVGAVLGGAIGYTKGASLGKEADIEIALGIDKAVEQLVPNGKGWIAVTEWQDIEGRKHKLLTGQTEDKMLITEYNDELLSNHEIKSGSKVNVTRYHNETRSALFAQLKARH